MMNKKAQSQIITTVLIILLVLAAIVIVWQVVKTTVEGGSDQVSAASNCLGLNLEIVDVGYTAELIDVADSLTFKVTRRTGADSAEVSSLKILIGGTDQEVGVADDGITTTLDVLATTDLITIEGELSDLDFDDFADKKLEVAAILVGGQVCDIADTVDEITVGM